MKNSTVKEAVVYTICLLFVLLFVYAAMNKILHFEHFRIELGQSPLLTAFAAYVSIAVPLIEIVISALLLLPRYRKAGLYASFSLMVMFTVYIIIILNWSSFIPCSCGGILSELGWKEHLVFNFVFVLLALAAIVLQWCLDKGNKVSFQKPVVLFYTLMGVFLGSVVTVVALYLLSEHEVHRNNGFVRRYPHHPVNKITAHNIRYNSYYIAGYAYGHFYLGNSSAPLHMLVADTILKNVRPITLKVIDGDTSKVNAVKVRVREPYFYLTDGTVPLVYKGELKDLVAKPFLSGLPKFSHLEPLSNAQFVIRSLDSKRNTHIIGRIGFDEKPFDEPTLIESQGHMVFDTDGMLLYNNDLQQVVYVYLYRNEFFSASTNLKLIERSRTIDTVQKANLKIASEDSGRIRKLAEQPTTINKKSCTSGRYLFVKSDRLGQYEPEEMLQDASIIDVYDLVKHTYEFSFYLYHHKGEEIKKFAVFGNLLVGLSEHYVVTYRLEKEYFNFGLNQP